MSLSKGVALVTGSAQGIGRGIALRLADEGYDIALNDIVSNKSNLSGVAEEIRSKKRKAFEVFADVRSEEQVKGMVQNTVKELGGLDVMVANAGISIWRNVMDSTLEDFESIFSVNVRGLFLCYKYAARQMVEQGRGGRIIGASSAYGKQGAPNLPIYSASKFAVRGFTQSLAGELGKHKITVNAYAPGVVDTPMVATETAKIGKLLGMTAEDFKHALLNSTPLGYMAAPADIGSLVAFLVSKEAHFITGQTLSINGGMNFD